MDVSPHVLRHTFLRKLAETTGVHSAREVSGHQSDRDIWRSVTPDEQTRAAAMDALAERPLAWPAGACHVSHRAQDRPRPGGTTRAPLRRRAGASLAGDPRRVGAVGRALGA